MYTVKVGNIKWVLSLSYRVSVLGNLYLIADQFLFLVLILDWDTFSVAYPGPKVVYFSAISVMVNYLIQGDHSTKVEGIVACLLQIHTDEPEAKTIVFSTVSNTDPD